MVGRQDLLVIMWHDAFTEIACPDLFPTNYKWDFDCFAGEFIQCLLQFSSFRASGLI